MCWSGICTLQMRVLSHVSQYLSTLTYIRKYSALDIEVNILLLLLLPSFHHFFYHMNVKKKSALYGHGTFSKQIVFCFVFLVKQQSLGDSPMFCFYSFFFGSACLLYLVLIKIHFQCSQSISCCYYCLLHFSILWYSPVSMIKFPQTLLESYTSVFYPVSSEQFHWVWRNVSLFLGELRCFFFFLRASVQGTADHCTITRRCQCLTPHHLETVATSLTQESNGSWFSM